jgi:predicted Zn-dependent peptidase
LSEPGLGLPIERRTLDNGLRVVLQRDDTLPLVAVNLWYHVGSKNERAGRTGFAHLFEHMLFQGSGNVAANDHFRYIQQVGGLANGSTWYDRTNYFETLPSHCLELGLWLESDRLGFLLPALDSEKLETQREVVMNERRQRVDNQPYGRAFERLHELVYPSPHPYHWPVIGYMEDIEAATLGDVEEFFRTYYVPNNAVLSLTGQFETERAFEQVERYFGELSAGATIEPVSAETPPHSGERREEMADDVELSRLYLGFAAPGLSEADWYAGDLLAAALAGGKSSPLYRDLVYERQIAQDVSAAMMPTELAATFVVVTTARPGTGLDELEAAVNEHLDAAAREALAASEIDRARNRLVTSYCAELQSVGQRADLLSQFTTYFDDPGRIDREMDHYELPASELVRFAVDHLVPDNRVALSVVPRENTA